MGYVVFYVVVVVVVVLPSTSWLEGYAEGVVVGRGYLLHFLDGWVAFHEAWFGGAASLSISLGAGGAGWREGRLVAVGALMAAVTSKTSLEPWRIDTAFGSPPIQASVCDEEVFGIHPYMCFLPR